MTSATREKIAGAPISWGVCEVPGWGYQLAPDRVLAEMREVGLTATELGPDGFLPSQPEAMAQVLDQHQLQAVGGFTPLLLHVPTHDPVPEVDRLLDAYAASGADGSLVVMGAPLPCVPVGAVAGTWYRLRRSSRPPARRRPCTARVASARRPR